MKDIIGDYEEFIQSVSDGLNTIGVDRAELSMMDHICYRVETEQRYRELLQVLQTEATLLGENEVSGRQIATFEFNNYPQVDGWTVPYLELPAPKEGSPYAEGLEHAELVVIGSLGRFLERHEDLSFSLGGMSKAINPEAGLKRAGLSVKFHEQQLGSVVRIEKALAKTS